MENVGLNKESILVKGQEFFWAVAALIVALLLLNYFIFNDNAPKTNVSEKDAKLVDMASVTSLK